MFKAIKNAEVEEEEDPIYEEFKDFDRSDFIDCAITEGERIDIIMDMKIEQSRVEVKRQERCANWVLFHSNI